MAIIQHGTELLNDSDISASTLLNLDLSMSEMNDISQQLVSLPLQDDQSVAASVELAGSPCDRNERPVAITMETSDNQLNTSLVQSADLQSTKSVAVSYTHLTLPTKRIV